MADKNKRSEESLQDPTIEEMENQISIGPEAVAVDEPAQPESAQYFTRVNWCGVRDVFKCVNCESFRDTEDQMISHIISHYPHHGSIAESGHIGW